MTPAPNPPGQGSGTLYMVPVTIADGALHTLAPEAIRAIHALRHFVAENARSARRFIKATEPPYAISEIHVSELDKHHPDDLGELLAPLAQGMDVGFLSEAGSPGVADPGARLAAFAHARGYRVKPLTGPSSILLALMACGLDSQRFLFHGYLPRDKGKLVSKLRQLETESRKRNLIQVCIETPYRNTRFLETCFATLSAGTHFTIAAGLTSPQEWIVTHRIASWQALAMPDLDKVPAVFCFLAQ